MAIGEVGDKTGGGRGGGEGGGDRPRKHCILIVYMGAMYMYIDCVYG